LSMEILTYPGEKHSFAFYDNEERTEYKQHFPQDSWMEHDPLDIWNTQKSVIEDVAKVCSNIKAAGITNQRETTATAARPALVMRN